MFECSHTHSFMPWCKVAIHSCSWIIKAPPYSVWFHLHKWSAHWLYTHHASSSFSCLCLILWATLEEGRHLSLSTSDNSTLTTPIPLYHTTALLHTPRAYPTHSTLCIDTSWNNSFIPCNPLTKTPRNPENHSRPTFQDLTHELARDPEALLSWSEQDKAASSKAVVLGAALEEGKHLYQELQQKYK